MVLLHMDFEWRGWFWGRSESLLLWLRESTPRLRKKLDNCVKINALLYKGRPGEPSAVYVLIVHSPHFGLEESAPTRRETDDGASRSIAIRRPTEPHEVLHVGKPANELMVRRRLLVPTV
jgi:hypothetical protein